ncbi:DUF262 domain-containing protein [Cryobacterium soli]|uniref:DUF262 domain-containing protein n=1 Tax=Cryobacterium soli TaxID=2220095 RepID=UPI000E74B3BD|nr:DUF262 domain-containing protein [Cryobacterium soli]
MTQESTLDAEIGSARRKISTESYPMSIGELTNLYRDGELVIRPAFQRLFRWDVEQKSRLVESILLGIPLPSIFVSQTDDGKWELIDGLQRVSTMLQMQGLLPDYEPLELQPTKYLPNLGGLVWDGAAGKALSDAQKLDFKRSKIDIKIVRRESDVTTKYDLFQRLNSYGSPLTAQEMRHALLVGVNADFASWLEVIAQQPSYLNAISLPDKMLTEKYAEELVLRFIYLHKNLDITAFALRGFNQKLDDGAVAFAEAFPGVSAEVEATFSKTFDLLNDAIGADAFRKWDTAKGRFAGGFLNTAYEVMAMGLGFHIANGTPYRTDIYEVARELWARPEMTTRFATGVSTEKRLSTTLPLGRELFQPKLATD